MRFNPGNGLLALSLAAIVACSDHEPYSSTVDPPPIPPVPGIEPARGLWLASSGAPALLRLAPTQLRMSGPARAATTVSTTSSSLAGLNSVAFDMEGTLWVASEEDSLLLAFPVGALSADGTRAASVVLRSVHGSISAPSAIAFDPRHGLWVANPHNRTLAHFDAAQLVSSGAPEPSVVISGVGHPSALAFDAAGSLWVADDRAHTIAKFLPAQLVATGAPRPHVVIRGADHSVVGPAGLAFDAAGSLWVTNIVNATVVSFTRLQLDRSGTVSPNVVLTLAPSFSVIPSGLAFDEEGSLWVLDVSGLLVKFAAAELVGSGSPEAAVRLRLERSGFMWNVAFLPRPAGLPLF